MEKVTTKRLALYSGRTHRELAQEVAGHLDIELGPDTRLVDCIVGAGATVEHSVGIDSEVGPGAIVGPYAHLPAGSSIPEATTTGAFYTAPVG